jgi:RND family efflux transporter MFP subunit
MADPTDEEHAPQHAAPVSGRSHRFGWGAAAVLLALGSAAAAAWQYGRPTRASAQQADAAPPPPAVTVSTPLERRMGGSTTFTGQFSAVDQVQLQAQVTGYLTEIHFTDGQIVHKGDLLFVIDPRPYAIQLEQAKAQLDAATAALELAERQLTRTTDLQRSDFASRDLLDQRVQARRAAEASIEQAKAAIHSGELNLEFTRVTAPFSGRIGAHQISVGSLVLGGTGAVSNTVLATIVSLDPIHLDFDMSEADYLAWRHYEQAAQAGGALDRKVDASLSDETGWTRTGVLDFVDNQMDRGSGTLHARATLSNSDLLIVPGQFARLRVPTAAPRPVLLVPDAALIADQSTMLVMTVTADGTVVPKLVQVGQLEGDLREITAGLAASDRVIIAGLVRARPGAKVTPQPGNIKLATAN